MSGAYSATVLEHFRRPRNQRRLERPTASHEAHNPLCGDRVRMELEIVDARVVDAAFTASACAICTAAASLLTERLPGAPATGDGASEAELVAALGGDVPPARRACVALPLTAVREALRSFVASA